MSNYRDMRELDSVAVPSSEAFLLHEAAVRLVEILKQLPDNREREVAYRTVEHFIAKEFGTAAVGRFRRELKSEFAYLIPGRSTVINGSR